MREVSSRRIRCRLTDRVVTVTSQTVSAYGESRFAQNVHEGRLSCLNMDLSCPNDCLYISGGQGFGRDPETGERVVVR